MTKFMDICDLLVETCLGQKDRAQGLVDKAEKDRDEVFEVADRDLDLLEKILDAYYDGDHYYTEYLCGMLGQRGELLRRHLD